MSHVGTGSELRGRKDERTTLDGLLAEVRSGRSGVLVLWGEAGVGKTALLDYLCSRATDFQVTRWVGVESEMELAFAGLRQLCEPFLDRLDRLAQPQREALATALGFEAGRPADPFLIGLAVLNLLAERAEHDSVLWVIDDAQWLDRISAQVLGFVARRLLAERVAIVFAVRDSPVGGDLAGLPELAVDSVDDVAAREILASVVSGPLDSRVRDRIIAEAHGNPLALLELPQAWTAAEWTGYGRHGAPLTNRIEQSFIGRLEPLSTEVRRFLLVAAAEPVGDTALLWRALDRLGVERTAAITAEATGLIEVGTQVRFRHPLVRSAAYRSMPSAERLAVHRALAEVTNPEIDPDRRAWHRSRSTIGPDEGVAAELEAAAGRARARGGLVAAATFLEHAARLTPDPGRHADRALAAAWAMCDAGSLDAALSLLSAVDSGPAEPRRAAQAEHLRGQIAFDQARGAAAAQLLLSSARQLEPLDPVLARDTHLEALSAAMWASNPRTPASLTDAARAARTAPPAPEPPRVADLLLDGLAIRLTDEYANAAPTLVRALDAALAADIGADDVGRLLWMVGNRVSGVFAAEVWDFEAGYQLAKRQVRLARDAGAFVQLQFALNFLANYELLAGRLEEAALLIEEDRLVGEATGNPTVGYSAMVLAAFRGEEALARDVIAAETGEEAARERGRIVTFGSYAAAVLYNGLARYDAASSAAREVFDYDVLGYSTLVVGELAEAALHTGDLRRVSDAAEWLAERAQVTQTAWVQAMEARVRAMLHTGPEAEALYRQAIDQLATTPLRPEVARSHLLYGEWLRREGRRTDARAQLHTAHDMLAAMGMNGFAERARRELIATGATARKRSVETTQELTAQEAQIARLARDGFSNPEIGARLFLSPRTVEWHMSRVFTKLGVSSRRQLRQIKISSALVTASAPAST
jgi:DNA-binding CsgD family transcriptional regulator